MAGHEDTTPPARVVVLAGPSGCGKTRLAERSGLPIVALDDFYRDADDPGMPRHGDAVDWEDPRSWDGDEAVAALAALCHDGVAEVPVYSIADDRRVDTRTVALDGSPVVIAEGIFAAEIVSALHDEGILADALLIHSPATVTFVRRLVRDLREGRKPPRVLLRQGWEKLRTSRRVSARQAALGCRRIRKPAAIARLADLGAAPATTASTAAAA